MTVVASCTSCSSTSTSTSTTQSNVGARFLASGAAGGMELALFHPVDTAAKRLMASPVRLSLSNYGQVIFQEPATAMAGAGGISGNLGGATTALPTWQLMQRRIGSLFPGLGYGAVYKISQRSYKFGGQPIVKDWVRNGPYERLVGPSGGAISRALLCDGLAGAILGAGEVLLLPFDVLKIKAQTNPTYRGRNFLAVFKQEGVKNLYAGWEWTMLRNIPGSFALFGMNAVVRDRIFGLKKASDATFLQTCAMSTCGTLASILVACPCDVVKTRIQSGRFGTNPGGLSIAANVLKEEGVGGFFKGSVPKCGAVGPKLIFSFTIAQYLMAMVEKRSN
ncbi:unnamed protein product [Amoebophrya sp. A25]|nr:unnamed protein product [Amoebophrya sp. A25]|eukprot:GSA25T00009184001.1